MHSRKKGKSGSTKPVKKVAPDWLIYDKDEIVDIVKKLAKEGYTNSVIGIILRDQYGIPDVSLLDLKISEITKKVTKREVPEDLMFLLERAVRIHKHIDNNKSDGKNRHGLDLVESKIRRLAKYYRRVEKLPEEWKYTRERAELLVE